MESLSNLLALLREATENASNSPTAEQMTEICHLAMEPYNIYQSLPTIPMIPSLSTALLQITALPSACVCCTLRAEAVRFEQWVTHLVEKLDELEAERCDALRRQIAINLEWELK